jgi:hypothetical protein
VTSAKNSQEKGSLISKSLSQVWATVYTQVFGGALNVVDPPALLKGANELKVPLIKRD